jgi:hypothetical protein
VGLEESLTFFKSLGPQVYFLRPFFYPFKGRHGTVYPKTHRRHADYRGMFDIHRFLSDEPFSKLGKARENTSQQSHERRTSRVLVGKPWLQPEPV